MEIPNHNCEAEVAKVGHMKKLNVLLILFLCSSTFLISCGNDGGNISSKNNRLVTSTGQYQSLQISLTTRSISRGGEMVPMTFKVENIGTRTVFVTSGEPEADAQVRQGDALIWQWSFGKEFPSILNGLSIEPGQSKTYALNWNQKDNEGNQVSPGSYTVNAWFNADSVAGVKVTPQSDLATQPISIVIQ
jgi:hypothetical protein